MCEEQPPRAEFSPDRLYRYTLRRDWMFGQGRILWIMLNPSKADENDDDSTIIKCISFSKRWGYAGLMIGNLYGFMSTEPQGLLTVDDPVGPDNASHLQDMMIEADDIIVAWGNPPKGVPPEAREVVIAEHRPLWCLGKTNGGEPKHPVRLGYKTQRELYFKRGE